MKLKDKQKKICARERRTEESDDVCGCAEK
jgi:hypothetical protein